MDVFENFENPIVSMLAVSTVETIYMVFLSTIFSLLLGFPIGVFGSPTFVLVLYSFLSAIYFDTFILHCSDVNSKA